MGVKDLWNIISPSCERKPLYELQGKVIAIDLSGWVVDSQSIVDNVIQPKMHLRNLFFRTAYLLMNEIYPVFVLEGTAPSLKHKTIAKRNEVRNGPTQKKTNRKGGRSNFNKILKECEKMLKYMGISCIRGQGEAEALCALLNAEGLVDGCISQDSDCFLYGAKVVYRNFCTSAQGNRGTTGGSIDEYTIEKIERLFNLGRNKMIALALLCGCDYDDGVNGVGKEAALKLFKVVNEINVIERMKSWKTDSTFTRMESELSNPNICTTCGHNGKMRSHIKSGCGDCGTLTKCNDSYKEKRILISNELSIRKKTLLVDNFPNEELINEFLLHKDSVPSNLDLKWKIPDVSKFVTFMEMYVLWEPEYAYAKILPLLTRWQVRNIAEIPDERRLTMRNLLIPEKIKKPRNIKGIASYEIVWEDKEGIFKGMTLACTSDKENDTEDPQPEATPAELATLEPQHLFQKCYPLLVEEFENAKLAKKKKPPKKPRGKKAKVTEDETGEKTEVKKKAQRRPRKPKTTEVANNRKIDEFVKVNMQTLEDSFDALTITPKRKKKSIDVIDSEQIKSDNDCKINSSQLDLEAHRLNRILNGSLLRMFNELTPEDFPSEVEDESMSEKICNKSQAMNISFPENQNTDHKTNDFEYEFNLEPQIDLEYKFDLKSKFELEPEFNFELDCSMHMNNFNETLKRIVNLENEEEVNSINSPIHPINLMNESKNLDCTLKRIIDSHKNAVDYKKKPCSMIKSPNVFAIKKPRKKFDLVNFTFEKEKSPEPQTNYKISENCFKQSVHISNLLNSKSYDQDDSMDRFDRINASVERFLFGQELFKDTENPENSIVPDVSKVKTLEKNDSKIILKTINRQDFGEKTNVKKDSVKKVNSKDSMKNKNHTHFSLERTLHVQNLIKDIKNSVSSASDIVNVSVSKNDDKNNFEDDIDSLNSSLERLRFAHHSNKNFQNNENENNVSVNVFNLSKFKPEENESTDHVDVENSLLELLPIVQRSKDNIRSTKISINRTNDDDNNKEIEETDRQNFSYEENEKDDIQILDYKQNCFQFSHKEKKNKNVIVNEEIDNENCNEENMENFQKSDNDNIRRIIPDENEFTDESDMFDFSSECSRNFESPEVKITKEERRIRKSINIPLEKLKCTDKDESIDEFDLLISNCKPLHERLKEFGKQDIARTSTPDFIVTPGKKFSFGIDDLLNDTDL